MSNTDQRVRSIMESVFSIEVGSNEPIVRNETPAWDSLKHVELVFTLEDEFDVQFDKEELDSLNSVDSIVNAIEEHEK